MKRSKDWIQLHDGRRFSVIEPPDDIRVADFGALGNLCRFTGQTRGWRFYSVAEHCVRVSFRCEELAREADHILNGDAHAGDRAMRAARWGLLHDAPEAFVNDLNRPLKHQPELKMYRAIEDRIMAKIATQFSLGPKPPEVELADEEMLATEVRDLMAPVHEDWKLVRAPLEHVQIAGWMPDKARAMFFRRFEQLWQI